MDVPTFTDEDVTRLLAQVLERLRETVAAEPWPLSLTEVAARTGISRRRILDACRAGELEHVHNGDFRGMTHDQVSAMLTHYSVGGSTAAPATPADELAQARQLSRRNRKRQSPRKFA